MIRWTIVAAAIAAGQISGAQVPRNDESSTARGGAITIPAGTIVDFEIVDLLNSKTAKIDDYFTIRLIDPIVIDGREVVPAKTTGQGQVVHAKHSGMGGRPGELIITARYIACGNTRLALRGFHFGGSGENHAVEALAISVIPFAGVLVNGGEARVAAGTRGYARIAVPIEIPAAEVGCPATVQPTTSSP